MGPYSEYLPRRIKGRGKHPCKGLRQDGNRCTIRAAIERVVFENPEHADSGWYVVEVCEEHAGYDGEALKKQEAQAARQKAKRAK